MNIFSTKRPIAIYPAPALFLFETFWPRHFAGCYGIFSIRWGRLAQSLSFIINLLVFTAYGNLWSGITSLPYDKPEEIAKAMEVTIEDIINMPEQFNIQNITNYVHIGYNYVDVKLLSELALDGYKLTIEELKAQVEYLKGQVDKLTDKLVGK